MPEKIKKPRSRVKARPTEVQEDRRTKRGQPLAQEMEEILDEIDEVLEENAQQFVEDYRQQGGQ